MLRSSKVWKITEQLNAEFQRKAREDKELYPNEQCNLMDNGSALRQRTFLQRSRKSHRKFMSKVGILKSKDGKDLIEEAEI